MTLATRPVPVLAAAAVACAAIVLGASVLATPIGAALAGWSAAGQEAVFALILYGTLAAVAVVGRRLAGVEQASGAQAAWLLLGAATGIGGLALALGDAALAGGVARGAAGAGAATLLLGTLVTLGQAASEELFFRGWVQPVLVRGWGAAAGIAATAAAFAALHVAGGARAPLTLVNLALGGVLFGVLAWRSGGLAAPIAAHAGWNWSEGILFGLDPNPGAGSFGAVHDLDLTGAAMWGGSGEGLNASLAMGLVLLALIVPLVLWPRATGAGIAGAGAGPGARAAATS